MMQMNLINLRYREGKYNGSISQYYKVEKYCHQRCNMNVTNQVPMSHHFKVSFIKPPDTSMQQQRQSSYLSALSIISAIIT